MVRASFTISFILLLSLYSASSSASIVEENRIALIKKSSPATLTVFSQQLTSFKQRWAASRDYEEAKAYVVKHSNLLWLSAKQEITNSGSMDDRPLYWARLLFTNIMRENAPKFPLSESELNALISTLEYGSRGRGDLAYKKKTTKRILLTGFDPFLLDRHINQSNPSGVAALLLDGTTIEYKGITAEINTVMIPVRYKDFDDGLIESILAPYYALNNVDMIVTVSMGRENFDLERFPGKRRSASAPGNSNVYAGGSSEKPIIPMLNTNKLPGNEFVLFSLPVKEMQKGVGVYKINDNHNVTSLQKGKISPKTIQELQGDIAVNGSGGGYLSNEISYRSIRLKDELKSSIPTGHIHTPRIAQFEPETEAKIIKQLRSILEHSLIAL